MPDPKEQCAAVGCQHARDMHDELQCSKCSCPHFYVRIQLSPNEAIVTNNDIVTNADGGLQTHLDFDFTQLDADMLMRVARVLKQGADKYGEKNWQLISTHDHINHMIYHAIMANTNDTSEDHLANTICRAMFAMWTKQNDLVVQLESDLASLKSSPYAPGIAKIMDGTLFEPPPFGYRKFDTYPGGVTAPATGWCYQCVHDAKAHIITPNIDGDVLTCAKCECRQQLQEGQHWCEHCKHPLCDCYVTTKIADPPPENICECGHHLIAHESNDYSGRVSWDNCRKCSCLRFVQPTVPVVGQGTE